MPALVSFRDVGFTVDGRPILSGFGLQVEEGETVVLLGRSGSGKTTALKMVNALRQPTSGSVEVLGQTTSAWDVDRLRRQIGYVVQEGGLFPHWTVAENVAAPLRVAGAGAPQRRQSACAMLERVGLAPARYADRLPRELSGGERQRVGVARALVGEPRLLLFDEPFSALDPVARLELQRLFAALRRELGTTALFVTHDLNEAQRVGTRIAVLAGGRVVDALPADRFAAATSPEAAAFQEAFCWPKLAD